MRPLTILLLLISPALLQTQAWAIVMQHCFRFDLELADTRNLTIAYGSISSFPMRETTDKLRFIDLGEPLSFSFKVDVPVFGYAKAGETLTIYDSHTSFPDYVAYKKEVPFILLLKDESLPAESEVQPGVIVPPRTRPRRSPDWIVVGLIPADGIVPASVKDAAGAAVLFRTCLASKLVKSSDSDTQRQLIQTWSTIAEHGDATTFRKFVSHRDPALRSTAIAAVAKVTPTDETLEAARADMQQLWQDDHKGDFFQCYWYLDAEWNASKKEWLPLYRMAASAPFHQNNAMRYGILGLCKVGDANDHSLILPFRNHENPKWQQAVNEALSRR